MAKYVDNVEFLALLIKYKETKDRKAYERIGEILDSMGRKLLFIPTLINYTQDWKDEMYSEAMYNCLRYLDRYDCSRTNPFAYFTRVIWNSYILILNKENGILKNKEKNRERVWNENYPDLDPTKIEIKEKDE